MKTETRIKGKAIYQPAGAAEEYAKWACNLYKGCDHNCTYCYCKHGPLAHSLGGPHAVLKSTLGNEHKAVDIFRKELDKYRSQIIADGGLFFSFSSDPFLPQSTDLSMSCIMFALEQGVPVYVLTKATGWVYDECVISALYPRNALLHIGFTLTGHDELEPGAQSNKERIETIRHLSEKYGFSIFASMEPVIDFEASLSCITDIMPYVDEVRIGLLSPYSPRRYDWDECDRFISEVTDLSLKYGVKVQWKESINRFYKENMPEEKQCKEPDEIFSSDSDTSKDMVDSFSCLVNTIETEKKPTSPAPQERPKTLSREEAFRQQVRESVEQRLNVFTKQENFFMAIGPLVIADIAWKYAERTTQLAAKYRIDVLKKLSRTVKTLRNRYDDMLRKDLNNDAIKRISTLSQTFRQTAANDFTILCLCANSDIKRILPDDPYADMRTEALCGYVMLELLKYHNTKMDELIMQRCGHHDAAPNPTLDALRDALDAYISPDKVVLSDNARLSIKILYNKLSQMDFTNEK